jgi:hypothetical protein
MAIKIKNSNKLQYSAFRLSSLLAITDKSRIDDEFIWLKILSKAEREEFKSELYDAISDAIKENDWSNVSEIINSWKETAEIMSDKKLMRRIKKSAEEYEQGKVIRWENVQKELEQL